MKTDTDDDWPAPGKGEWVRLADHFDRPWTAEYERIFRPAFLAGADTYLHDYGLPVRMIDVRTVHGYPYLHPVPLVGPDSSRATPALMIAILSRVVPALRRCERNAARTLRERPWRARAAQWWRRDRVAAIDANRHLAAVDPTGLDDRALARHLEASERLAAEGYEKHFALHGTDMFPVGLYLDGCRQLGIDIDAALDLIVDEYRQRTGPTQLDSSDLAQTIVDGYDIDRQRLCELPGLVHEAHSQPAAAAHRETVSIDDLVPPARRAAFDVLFEDACAVLPVRDDNGVVLGAWRMGLLRRAYLEAGARLVTANVLEDSTRALEAEVPELCAALEETSDDHLLRRRLDDRAVERRRWAEVDAPLRLGHAADVPVQALPRSMRTVTGGQLVLRDLIERAAAPNLEGLGIGTTAAVGTARVAMSADDAIARLEPGDVLVVRATSPALNAVLPLACAIVTEHGGALSHAAVAARELGIPALIGVRGVTSEVTDGARLRVDPIAGCVSVVEARPARRAVPTPSVDRS